MDMGRILGGAVPLLGGSWAQCNTMSHGLRPTSLLSGILIHPAVWSQQKCAENWEAVPLFRGRAGSPSNTMWFGSRSTSIPSGILIHPAVWPQQTWAENCGYPFGWELGHHLTQCRLGQGIPPYQVALWSIQPFGHNRHGPKIGIPLWVGDGSPYNTMWPGPRPT